MIQSFMIYIRFRRNNKTFNFKKSDKILPDLDKEINYNLIDEYHKN